MSGEGTRPGSDVLLGLTRFRVGRFLLWTAAALLGLMGLVPGPERRNLLAVAAVFALFAAYGSWSTWYEERQSPDRASLSWLIPRLVLGGVLLGGALLLVWWRRRRFGSAPPLPPPSQEEVDRWATDELRAPVVEGVE